MRLFWPSGLVCVVGRYKAGNVLSPCSISAGRPEVTVDFLSRQAFPLASLYEQTSLSVALILFLLVRWTPDLISYQILTVILLTKVFPLSFFFSFPFRYQSGFNDLLFSLQKLPPNLNFSLPSPLFYLVPCYQMNNSKVSFVSQTFSLLKHIQFSS